MNACIKIVISVLLTFLISSVRAAEPTFTEAQKKVLEQMFHDYIVNNPEVLIEASQVLQQKQQRDMLARAQAAIPEHSKSLFQSKSPAIGGMNASVDLVAFFDYQCHHCREMYTVIHKLVENDKSLKVIFKEFPIFGEVSEYASKVALAANKQNKYFDIHGALMKAQPPLSIEKIKNIATMLKLDMKRLEQDMADQSIAEELKDTMSLAQNLGIMGTPAFVIAGNINSDNMKSYFVPGASTYQMLQSLIQQARENSNPANTMTQTQQMGNGISK